MAISPWYVGQTLPVATITLTQDGGGDVNLSGATSVDLSFRNELDGTSFSGAGSAVVSDAANGKITYTWNAADVTSAKRGKYTIRPTVHFATGDLKCDPIPWELKA